MILILILCALTIALTYYQTFTQGLYSAVIMAVLSIISAVIAFNYYEQVAGLLNGFGFLSILGPNAVALMAVFLLTLCVLRELTDRFIKGNMRFPETFDRAGSFVFGLISSLVMVGIISIGFQSMPVDLSKLGYQRYKSVDELNAPSRLYPCGDEFVVALMKQVSAYSFAGKIGFGQNHPNLLQEIYLNNHVPEDFEGMRLEAAHDAMQISKAVVIENELINNETRENINLNGDETLIGVEIVLEKGREKGSRGVDDVDRAIRFTPGQIRMIGNKPDGSPLEGVCVHPLGSLSGTNKTYIPMDLDTGIYIPPSDPSTIRMLFKWPYDLKKAHPRHIEFKMSAQANMPNLLNNKDRQNEPAAPDTNGVVRQK